MQACRHRSSLTPRRRPPTGIRLEGLVKSFATPDGEGASGARRRSRHREGRDARAARPERRGQVDPDRHAARTAATRHRHASRCSGARRRRRSTKGAVGAMLQTGGLLRGLSVRELVSMMASLYPDPLPVDEVLELTGTAPFAERRTEKLSGGQTQRARFALALVCNPELLVLDEPTVALDVEARHAFWTTMRGDRGRGPHGALRDALPRGGGRLRRPHRRDGCRSRRRRRAAHRDQGAWSARARSARRSPTPTSTPSGDCPGSLAVEGRGSSVVLRCSDSDRAIRALLDEQPGRPRHRDQRGGPGRGLPRAHRQRRPRGGPIDELLRIHPLRAAARRSATCGSSSSRSASRSSCTTSSPPRTATSTTSPAPASRRRSTSWSASPRSARWRRRSRAARASRASARSAGTASSG